MASFDNESFDLESFDSNSFDFAVVVVVPPPVYTYSTPILSGSGGRYAVPSSKKSLYQATRMPKLEPDYTEENEELLAIISAFLHVK